MAPSRAFCLSSSSASSRHANRARAASDEEEYSDADNHYRAIKKASALPSKTSVHKLSASATSRSKRPNDDADADYDQLRAVKKSASSTHRNRGSSKPARHDDDEGSEVEGDDPASAMSDELLMDTRAFSDYVDKKLSKLLSKREQMLEERLDRITSQRDEIQAQYDDLRQLRNTDAEKALDEFKKTAEARYRHDKDLINSLKVKVEAAEKRAKEAEGGASGANGGDRSMSILNASVRESVQPETPDRRIEELEKQHRKEMAEAVRQQKRLEEDVRAYKLQLEQEIAQSKAHGAKASAANGTSAASASLAALEDEKAVRKLYEDLTGLVVTGVERIDANQTFRRFKAIFAQEDYYSVLMDLEESSSKISSSSGTKSQTRDDIVYVPKIDDDRDSELLNSQMVPQEWLDALRFDRNMLFKWYEKTRKALLTDEARMKIRAREERAGRH
ncbi:uncharacterized protein SPSC_04035 [Sporisorium scitamineum]|uniref:Monopolin complex subunit Csm1/Pcs1 C-terminal domain-containing protein n=1 Tax=Sporisorium scitamineum TaxID=49012 RepID=A0A0F7RXI5_9BASI|nr:hypothetical protein [Sporisorium scitamineum]CDU24534.1 uncharacterized protein SPSC_04035 [Sporisorium scitamineum]